MGEVSRPKVSKHPVLLTEHVFDKLWSLDIALGEFLGLLNDSAEVIEESRLSDGELKELVLNLHWSRPLHVVVVIDDNRHEERVVTVYEPDNHLWSDDFRRRR